MTLNRIGLKKGRLTYCRARRTAYDRACHLDTQKQSPEVDQTIGRPELLPE